MGTSANLAVRYQGRTFIQYTSHDASPGNVLPEILSTLSAVGVEELRAAIARQPDPETIETDFDRQIDIRTACNAYIEACQARGREPFGLQNAIAYKFGNPDYAHGGVIPMLAPVVDWHKDQCSCIEQASYILDLDKNVLGCVNEVFSPGDYDKGNLRFHVCVNLDKLDNFDPEQVYTHFFYCGVSWESKAQEKVDQALKDLEDGKRLLTPQQRHEQWLAENPNRFDHKPTDKQRPAEPAIYQLSGTLGHIMFFQAILGLLREKSDEYPILAKPGTLKVATEEYEQEDGNGTMTVQTLFVDLREEANPAVHFLVESALSCFRENGMRYRSDGPGFSAGSNPFVISSSFSVGMSDSEKSKWDKDIIPDNAANLGTYGDYEAMIDQAIANSDLKMVNLYYQQALVDMNQSRLEKIEQSGLAGLDVPELLKKVKQRMLLPIAIDLAKSVDNELPGTLAQRFNRLSEENRQRFFSAMTPVDVYVFTQMLNESQRKLDKPQSKRSARIGR